MDHFSMQRAVEQGFLSALMQWDPRKQNNKYATAQQVLTPQNWTPLSVPLGMQTVLYPGHYLIDESSFTNNRLTLSTQDFLLWGKNNTGVAFAYNEAQPFTDANFEIVYQKKATIPGSRVYSPQYFDIASQLTVTPSESCSLLCWPLTPESPYNLPIVFTKMWSLTDPASSPSEILVITNLFGQHTVFWSQRSRVVSGPSLAQSESYDLYGPLIFNMQNIVNTAGDYAMPYTMSIVKV